MMNMFVNGDGDETVRFIQVTDPHLFKSTQGELLGINTQASLDQVLQEIQSSDFNYQFVLATGDLVQDSSEQGYRRFCESINRLKRTVFPVQIHFVYIRFDRVTGKRGIFGGKFIFTVGIEMTCIIDVSAIGHFIGIDDLLGNGDAVPTAEST